MTYAYRYWNPFIVLLQRGLHIYSCLTEQCISEGPYIWSQKSLGRSLFYVTRSLSIEYTTTRHKVREIFSLGAQQLILTCKRILLSSMSHAVSHFEMICIIETTYCTSRWCWRLHDSWQMMTLQWLRNRHNRSHLAVTVYFKSSFYIKISA